MGTALFLAELGACGLFLNGCGDDGDYEGGPFRCIAFPPLLWGSCFPNSGDLVTHLIIYLTSIAWCVHFWGQRRRWQGPLAGRQDPHVGCAIRGVPQLPCSWIICLQHRVTIVTVHLLNPKSHSPASNLPWPVPHWPPNPVPIFMSVSQAVISVWLLPSVTFSPIKESLFLKLQELGGGGAAATKQ